LSGDGQSAGRLQAPTPLGKQVLAVFDTNVFVAAGFRSQSASARLLALVADGRIALVWSEATRAETLAVLSRIPRLTPAAAAAAFRPELRRDDEGDLSHVAFVEDPEDRKFAALALVAGVPLVSSDQDLLAHADRLDVLTPGGFLGRCNACNAD